MKKVHLWGCLLLIILMTACEKNENKEVYSLEPSGQFVFKEEAYDLHYCYLRRNPLLPDCYEVLLYSSDKAAKLKLDFYTKEGGIVNGLYENSGLTVKINDKKVDARLSLSRVPGEVGGQYTVEFRKNTSGDYDIRIAPIELSDGLIVNWSGKLSQ